MPARGWLRRAIRFLNPGIAGLLFILFFIVLLAVMAPIALRIGKFLSNQSFGSTSPGTTRSA